MRDFSIDLVWAKLQMAFSVIGGWLGYFVGGVDGLMTALLIFMILDYVTGLMCAIADKKLSSSVGFRGICKKVLILMLVGNIFALVDVVFYLVMGILLLKKKKWGIALATTIYGGVGVLLTLFTSGGVTGIVALICGIMATKELKKFAALYAAYQQTGVLPAEPVVTSKRSMKNH